MISARIVRVAARVTLVAFTATGCATASRDIAATYVSPNSCQAYDCAKIAAEGGRLQRRLVQLGGRLEEAASNDKAIVGVGALLFWPVLFAVGGTKTQEAEFACLKGGYDALHQVAIEKKSSAGGAEAGATAAMPSGAATATTGTGPGGIESNADPADHADVTVTAEGPVRLSMDGVQVLGQRVVFRGFTTLPRRAGNIMTGAMPLSLKGSAVIEPVSGIVMSIEVQAEHPALAGGWTLARRRAATG